MQLIQKGPDIPERLLQAHEDGRVVFFCGAGISYPAGLPGFGRLVDRVYENLGADVSAPEASGLKKGLYDSVLGLLEGRVVDGRQAVRRQVASILTPDFTRTDATTTHDALLTLSLTRDGRQRLITTNFDRLFEVVKVAKNLKFQSYEAPLLPVPKNRWDGVVYLHGLLAETPNATDLNKLVLSSGDFGLAYLTERWAARFASELFRSLTVCFVGYSINDPVLRYMMDALAADRLLGESPPEVFAFGSYKKKDGGAEAAAAEWRAKNVTPILYREYRYHYYLHKTLHEWARIYRDGVLGKESFVSRYAAIKPIGSTQEDDFVGRLLWALSDRSGLPAKRFAEFERMPPLDWLETMAEPRYGHADLERFGVRSNEKPDDKLAFSLVARPAPYTLAAQMRLVGHFGLREGRLDEVMRWLAHWLSRHVDNPKLLLWVAGHGPRLHDVFAWHIERALEKPGVRPPMVRLWRLVLAGRLHDLARHHDVYSWRKRLVAHGYSPGLRLQLIDLLAPRVRLSRAMRLDLAAVRAEPDAEAKVRELVDWEIVLAADHGRDAFNGLSNNAEWRIALADMLPDFTGLLRDALDLMRELEGANDRSDLTYIAHPSISSHEQNRDFRDWTLLIDLTRDAWISGAAASPGVAKAEVTRWLALPYPIFRRLAFFAATDRAVFTAHEATEILLQEVWWLWSPETQREAMRLLVSIASDVDGANSLRVETAILNGPNRGMFRDDIEVDDLERTVDREIWLRLVKFQSAGGTLGEAATVRVAEIGARYPQWRIVEGDRDEFPFWMGDGEEWGTFTPTPVPRRELIAWLREHQRADDSHRDDWQERCKSDFPRAVAVLLGLARDGQWYPDRWRSALQAWADPAHLAPSWRRVAAPLAQAPDELLREANHAISWWLQAQAKTFQGREEQFFTLVQRVVALHRNDPVEADNDIVLRAINHPIGHAVQAALTWWHRQSLKDDQGLRAEVSELFSEISDPGVEIFRYGRVLLGSNSIALFRVDPTWTEQHLLPLFDWDRSAQDATAVWKGFLWAPRLYRPLLSEIKSQFLSTARHYEALGDHGEQYAGLLTYAALEASDLFTLIELRDAVAALPEAGRRRTARTLVDALDGAGEQRKAYWENRVHPFITRFWPKAAQLRTQAISEKFALICIASGDAFPDSFVALRGWLLRTGQPGMIAHNLAESGLCARFPEIALSLLDAVIADNVQWPPHGLDDCLNQIKGADALLEDDARYQRLHQIIRRLGRD